MACQPASVPAASPLLHDLVLTFGRPMITAHLDAFSLDPVRAYRLLSACFASQATKLLRCLPLTPRRFSFEPVMNWRSDCCAAGAGLALAAVQPLDVHLAQRALFKQVTLTMVSCPFASPSPSTVDGPGHFRCVTQVCERRFFPFLRSEAL